MLGNSKESMAVNVDEETKAGGGFFLSLFLSSFALWGVWGTGWYWEDCCRNYPVVVCVVLSFSFLLLSFAVFGKENIHLFRERVEAMTPDGGGFFGIYSFWGADTMIINIFITA